MKNMNIEGFTTVGHDHGETIQCFIKIEGSRNSFSFLYYSELQSSEATKP
jgi:replication factor C subunit 3/5